MTQDAQQEEPPHTSDCDDQEAGRLRDPVQDNGLEPALSEQMRLRETVLAELDRRKKLA